MKIVKKLINRHAGAAAGALVMVLALAPKLSAITLYTFSVNTTALAGQNGNLAFDFTGGDAALANNTVTASNFVTNGILSGTPIQLTDTSFFNETLRLITFGTTLSFTLQLSENRVGPGFDQLSFFLLNPAGLASLIKTSDPLGADALFAIDIDGNPGGIASVFTSSGLSWSLVRQSTPGAPDTGSTLVLLLFGLILLGGLHLAAGMGVAGVGATVRARAPAARWPVR